LWRASQSSRGGGAIGEICECRFNEQLTLRARVQHIRCDEKFKCAEAARASEMTYRSAFCAFADECGERGGCITFSERGARGAQRFGEFGVAFTQWFWLWEERAARKRKWKSGGDGGAQRCNARAEQRSQEKLCIKTWACTPCSFKCFSSGAQQRWAVRLTLNELVAHSPARRSACSAAASAS
jgi:hypothetical protein